MGPEDLETLLPKNKKKNRAQLRYMGMAGVSAPNDLTFGLSKVLINKKYMSRRGGLQTGAMLTLSCVAASALSPSTRCIFKSEAHSATFDLSPLATEHEIKFDSGLGNLLADLSLIHI